MSEKIQPSGQEFITPNAEKETSHEAQSKNVQHEAQTAAPERSVEELTMKVEAEALSSAEYSSEEKSNTEQHPVLINKQLKDMAFSRALVRTRKHLSVPSRIFSKAIHSKILDKPSETIGKTVARPSSMVGGAIIAFFGTSILLWVTKKYGYEYNYLAVIVIFVIGMIGGLIIESLFKLVRKRN